jgi:hypothetical protein
MRKPVFILLMLMFSGLVLQAAQTEKRVLNDTITGKLLFFKEILNDDEWVVTDSATAEMIKELVSYIENSPVDSLLKRLKNDLDSNDILFSRSIEKIPNPEKIAGYISKKTIERQSDQNARIIRERFSEEQIMVPETLFSGMYSKLPLVTADEAPRMLTDSVIQLPDTLVALFNDPDVYRNKEKFKQADSLKNAFIEQARVSYNDSLIRSFRDSVTTAYRREFIQDRIDSVNKRYTDSVYAHNVKILNQYNDSVIQQFNNEAVEVLQSLITFVNRMPNNIIIHNLYGQDVKLSLQNEAAWYKWIWLKNHLNDSIGIKVENLDKHNLRMVIDETVNLSRLTAKEPLEIKEVKSTKKSGPKLVKVMVKEPVLSPWELQGNAYAGFTQTYINDYWSQGGKSSASALTTFNYDVKYVKNKIKWDSSFDLKLGLVYYIPEEETETQRNWHKNTDNVELNSRFGYSAFKKWYYSADANFKTQLFDGYKNVNDTEPLSSFFSPAYLTFSAGMEYKPNKNFGTFVAPISLKTTYVTDPDIDETKFGLNEGDTQHSRIGLVGKLDYKEELFENVSLKTKNSIFINYGNNNDGEWQFLKLPDFDSETTIDFKVNQFISTQLNVHFVYDKDVESTWTNADNVEVKGTRLQVKEFFTLGISYRL